MTSLTGCHATVPPGEAFQQLQPQPPALLRVELGGKDIAAAQGRAEVAAVVGHGVDVGYGVAVGASKEARRV